MRNFAPTIICLVTLIYVALRDGTASVPPNTWYDVLGILAVVGLIASFIWGIAQQTNANDVINSIERRAALYNPRRGLNTNNPPKPTAPPNKK